MTFILLTNFISILIFMIAVWLLSLLKQDASIANRFWGIGFVLIAWMTFFLTDGNSERKLLITMLTTIWGARLAIYLFYRYWGREEDKRYQKWRAGHGDRFWIVSLYTVFGLQGVLVWMISLPLQIGQIASMSDKLTWLNWFGVGLWLRGFLVEAISDWQLHRFKNNPQNSRTIMNSGLWKYTRHPNYFGEAVLWWGMFLIALTTPANGWTIISPILMTGLLLKVSGVSLLEKTILETKPRYREYMQRTNAFIPWFPRKITE